MVSQKRSSRAQSAMEYILIAGLIAVVVVPTTFIFYRYASDSAENIDHAQIDKFGRDVVNTAESVYYLGPPSRIIIEERLPKNIQSMSIDQDPVSGNYLFAIAAKTNKGTVSFTYPTSIQLSGNFGADAISAGIKNVRIESERDDSGKPLVLVSFYRQKRAFVTSSSGTGDLIGLTGADATCQALAETAGLDGSWIAWLSTSTVAARDRITDTKYLRLDGAKIANNLADLTDGAIANPIQIDENGQLVTIAPLYAWTGTAQDGNAHLNNCDDWTSADPAPKRGMAGGIDQTASGDWTEIGAVGGECAWSYRLYCFEK